MAVNVDILGKGWRFPFAITKRKGGTGTSASLSESEGVEHVKESIRQILGTPVGSRVMRRDFGSRLHRVVFAPNDSTIDTLVEHYVREAIERWENRVPRPELANWRSGASMSNWPTAPRTAGTGTGGAPDSAP